MGVGFFLYHIFHVMLSDVMLTVVVLSMVLRHGGSLFGPTPWFFASSYPLVSVKK